MARLVEVESVPTANAKTSRLVEVSADHDGGGNFITDGAMGLISGAAKGFGTTVLGVQRLLGKGIGAIGSNFDPSSLPNSTKTPQKSIISRAGDWLVNDADWGKAKLAAEVEPYRAASPMMSGIGEVGGSIVATGPVAKLIPLGMQSVAASNVAGVVPRAIQAAKIGAIYGGVTGATSSNADTLGGMLSDGVTGAGTGALLSGVATPVTAAVGAVGSNIRQRFSKTSAADFARQKIAEALARDARGNLATGGYTNPLNQAGARLAKLGDEATLADAGGRNTFQLLDTLATLPGRTKDATYNLLHRRAAGVGDRLRTTAENALDTQGQRLPSTIESLIARREADSAPLYNQLRSTTIAPTSELSDIIAAAENLGATGLGREIATARQIPFTLDTSQAGRWSMSDLDHVKQGIDQLLTSRKAINSDGSLTPLGSAYQSLKNRLINELDTATTNPATGQSLYRRARDAFSTPSALIDAANAGKLAIARDESSILNTMRGMSNSELQAFRIGAYEGLRDKLGTQGGQTNIMNMWKEPSTQEKLKAVFGDLRSYREFASGVAREAWLKRLQGVGAGSQTAARAAGMGDLDKSAISEAGGGLAAAKAGDLLSALGSAKNVWNRVATPQQVRDQMGAMLLDQGRGAQRNVTDLEALVREINNRNMLLSNNIGVFGGQVGNVAPTIQPKIQ